MIEDLDIWRMADFLIKRYGEDAELEAMLRANRAVVKGDLDGEKIWKRVHTAVQELDCRQPRGQLN